MIELKKDMSVIIPMHDFSKENVELLNGAIESVPQEMQILLSVPSTVKKTELSKVSKRVTIVTNDTEGTTFQDLVNNGVKNVKTKWFSILEFDDEYTGIWFDEAEKYINADPSTSVFMPLEDIIDFKEGEFIGYGNEAPLAASFSNELGYLDFESLNNFYDFYPTGSIFNTADFNEVGFLKPLIKVTFWYEWLLRATRLGKKVYIVPKVGYQHSLNRDGSLTETYRKEISEKETKWWFDLAKKDCHFKEQKDPEYYEYKEAAAK